MGRPANCPYCARIVGVGTGPWDGSEFDEPIEADARSVLVPTLGMLTPGYLLAVTRIHRYSYGALGRSDLDAVEKWIEPIRRRLSSSFGDTFVFEHGSAPDDVGDGTRSCILHAHMHLIPVAAAAEAIVQSLPFIEIGHYRDLERYAGTGYAFLDWRGRRWVAPGVRLKGQWVRRRVAGALGTPDLWDWEIDRGQENLHATLTALRHRKPPREGRSPA